jgi:hypothetical protein
MNWTEIDILNLVNLFKEKEYILLNGIYQANPLGIRAKIGYTNTFDDFICNLRKNHANVWELLICEGTVDPGKYWMLHPMNPLGTFKICPGQTIDAFKIGYHQNKYRALVQNRPIKGWRDNKIDLIYDEQKIGYGEGINLHHAGKHSIEINNWSAGCQVIAIETEFDEYMKEVDEHIAYGYKQTFNYTLFLEEDLI